MCPQSPPKSLGILRTHRVPSPRLRGAFRIRGRIAFGARRLFGARRFGASPRAMLRPCALPGRPRDRLRARRRPGGQLASDPCALTRHSAPAHPPRRFLVLPAAASVSKKRPVLRWLATLLALVVLVGPLSSALHFLIVRHGVCPEHGELTHLGPDGQATHAREANDGPVLESTRRAPAPHADEHCALAAVPPSPSAPPEAAPLVGPALLGSQVCSGLVPALAHPQVPALALAPKASPPSVHS